MAAAAAPIAAAAAAGDPGPGGGKNKDDCYKYCEDETILQSSEDACKASCDAVDFADAECDEAGRTPVCDQPYNGCHDGCNDKWDSGDYSTWQRDACIKGCNAACEPDIQ